MNSESPWKKLTEFTTRLHEVVETKPTGSFFEALTSGTVMFSRPELGGLMLSQEEASGYRRCVETIHEFVGGEYGRVSRSAVEDATQITILKALDATGKDAERDFPRRLTREIEELRKSLKRAPDVYVVHLEVRGLDARGLPRQMGNAKFYVVDETNVPGEASDEATETQGKGASALRDRLIASIKTKTYASIEVEAFDMEAAVILAERELRMTIDVLNYFGDLLSHEDTRVFLPGDAAPSGHLAIIENKNDSQKSKYSLSGRGRIVPFSFSSVNDPRAVGALDKASSLLQKCNRNRWDSRILAALQWAGRASVEERKEEALLLFCISLEALLLTNDDKELAYQFALRGAHLLVKDGSRRKEAFEDLKALYKIRSKIVHSGKAEIFAMDVAKANLLAKSAIFIVLTTEPFSRFASEKEFNDWVEEQTLTGVRNTAQGDGA
jgi:hypothetical protein